MTSFRGTASLRLLLLAVSLSGAAGLMYQVAWTRRLISVTSATATAQAVVLAIFMVGLGLGAWLAGRLGGRLRRPVWVYAACELLAAGLALLSFPLIDASNALGASGLWLQLGLVSGFLLLPTILLGASLPLLIDHCERSAATRKVARGRFVSGLYGINTLGAALGCWLAGFVTVEELGLFRTALVGAGLALAAACVAGLVRGDVRAPGVGVPTPSRGPRLERSFVVAAFVAGFIGLAAEVLWTRMLVLIVPTTVYAFSQVLIAVLLGIAIGALFAAKGARAFADEAHTLADARAVLARVAALAAVLLAVVPVAIVWLADATALQFELARGSSPLAALIVLACLVPPSAAVAAIFPLLVAASRRVRGAHAFGSLYAANTAGAVFGSLAAGFALLPTVGIEGTSAALVIAAAALAIGFCWRAADRWQHVKVLALAGVTCLLLELSHDLPAQIYESRIPEGSQVLEFREGLNSHVMVTQNGGQRFLWLNSSWVAASHGGHRVVGHLPALLVPEPRRALGIALGTGQTFAAILQHGVTTFDCVEIDAGVVELSRRWFGEVNGGLLDDARVRIHVNDGRAFLRAPGPAYDLIVLEPLQAWSAGTSNLYSREFYEEAARRLTPEGVVAQWIPFYGQGVAETRAMVRTGLDVFAQGSLWLTANDGVLILGNRPFELDFGVIERRIADRGLAEEFARFPVERASDLAVALLLGPDGLRRWSEGAEVLVDDRPFLEFRAARSFGRRAGQSQFREILASVRPHLDRLARYVPGGTDRGTSGLAASEVIRRARLELRLQPDDAFAARVAALERALPLAAHSVVWQRLYQVEIERWLQAPEVRAAGVAARARILARVERHAPRLLPRFGEPPRDTVPASPAR